jgi:hypothetical protein
MTKNIFPWKKSFKLCSFNGQKHIQILTLDEDIWHVNVLSRLGDVQIAFGIFF